MFGDGLGLRPICGQLPCCALMEESALQAKGNCKSLCEPAYERMQWLYRCRNVCGSELLGSRQPLVPFEVR